MGIAWSKKIISSETLRGVFLVCLILLLLLLPALTDDLLNQSVINASKRLFISLAFLFMPVVLFCRNIKIYLYLLLPWILLSPLFIYSLVLFNVRPGYNLFFLIIQTNLAEVEELTYGHRTACLFITILYLLLYWLAVKNRPYKKLPFQPAMMVSLVAGGIVCGL